MTLQFHPAVQQDFNAAISYYAAQGGVHLADRFEAEFRFALAVIRSAPTRFPFYGKLPPFRRVRLNRFPYVLVYRETGDFIRITLLKHERRHPLYGMERR